MDQPVRLRLCAVLREDPLPEVRAEAARALSVAAAASEDVVEPLLAALDDADASVRRAATLALGRTRDPRAVDALLRLLTERPELWQEVSAAMATAGDMGLVDRLTPLLDHEDGFVRQGALRAIAAVSRRHLAPPDIDPLFVYTDDEGHRHPLF